MSKRLDGLRILVTGAGAGIGQAIASACVANGARVIATSRSGFELPGAESVLLLDVTDAAAIASTVEEVGRIDVLINVAGYVHSGTILDCSDDDWERSLSVNVTSVYRLSRAVLPGMLERGRGNILTIGSVAGALTGTANRFAYGTSKAALIGLTKGIAADFIRRGIRANLICPSATDTPSLEARARGTGDRDAAWAAFNDRQPIGRLGRAEEVAALAVHLASDESAFTTGAVYAVDGGATM